MSKDTPPKSPTTSSIFSRMASLCASPFKPSDKRIATHRFCQEKSIPQYSTLIHSKMDSCRVLVRTWWEAQKIQGSDLYKIRREHDITLLEKLASYRTVRPQDVHSTAQDIGWNGKKAVSLPEAIEALKELESRAMTTNEFASIDAKQPLAKIHWSKWVDSLPQQIVKSSPSIRLKRPAPDEPKRR